MTRWKVRVGVEAEKDFVRILKYTADTFGERQASIYKTKLTDAITALEAGPDTPGSVSRDEILPNLRSLHVARHPRGGFLHMLVNPSADNSIGHGSISLGYNTRASNPTEFIAT